MNKDYFWVMPVIVVGFLAIVCFVTIGVKIEVNRIYDKCLTLIQVWSIMILLKCAKNSLSDI